MKEWDVGAFLARHAGPNMGMLTRIAIDNPEPNAWQVKTRPTHLLLGHKDYYEFWCSLLWEPESDPPKLMVLTHIPTGLPQSSRRWLETQLPLFQVQIVGTKTTTSPSLRILEREQKLDLFAGVTMEFHGDGVERLTAAEPLKEDVDTFLLGFLECFTMLYTAKLAGSEMFYRFKDMQ